MRWLGSTGNEVCYDSVVSVNNFDFEGTPKGSVHCGPTRDRSIFLS